MSAAEVFYRDFRTDGCPSDSGHLIGDDIAQLLDAGLPGSQLERPCFGAEPNHACRLDFRLSAAQAWMLGYQPADYRRLIKLNGLSPEEAAELQSRPAVNRSSILA